MLDLSEALSMSYDEVGYLDFYRDIFPEGSFEKRGVYEDGKYNGIAVSIRKGGKKTKRLTVTDDLEVIEEMVMTDDFCLMSPISYAGKSRKSGNARFMYAMAIDLDGIETLDQRDHVKVMNTMKALKKQLGEEVKEGRPKGSGTAEQTVREVSAL